MTTQEQQAKDALDMIAYVSRLLRQGIANSLPVSGDQYLTVAIPGTIIDTRDVSEGGSYVWTPTKTKDPLTPLAVQQAEAKLVDGMMPLATVIVGNTGRSVSRSYNRALDLLVPLKSAGSPGLESDPSDPRFTKAMDYLRSTDDVGRSPIDYYIAKQTAWQEAQSEWDSAKQDAHSGFLRQYPGGKPEDIAAIQQAMNEWNQVNFRKYKTNVQGKWMDWVTRGNKYEVENSFGVVDIESIMARIEESKESWRNSTIVDEDGANELQSVRLTPRNWAQLCQDKVTQWRATNGGYSYEQLEAEIERLTELSISMDMMKTAITNTDFPVDKTAGDPDPSVDTANTGLKTAYSDLYKSQGALNTLYSKKAAQDAIDAQIKVVQGDEAKLVTALKTYRDATNAGGKHSLQTGMANAQAWVDGQTASILASIAKLKDLLKSDRFKDRTVLPVIAGAKADPDNPDVTSTDLAGPSDMKERAVFDPVPSVDPTVPSVAGSVFNPWTTINVSYSASSFSQSKSSSSWGMSVSGGVNYGLFRLGGAYSHEEGKSEMYQDMAKCDVAISFDAMVVNINRPWLYGELFGDYELNVADGIKLSPGPEQLQQWLTDVKNNAKVLGEWTQFPSYPTSFVVAANTIIEFTGSTSHIEQHFSFHSNSGSISVGFGPFSMSGSFHEEAQNANVQMQATATGCKIAFGSPQIIAWTSQILPQLPRPKDFDPLVTNFV